MNWWRETPIFYKILSAFLLTMVIFAGFDVYLVNTLNNSQSLLLSLQNQYRILDELSQLSQENSTLSDSVKAYILTRDPQWETQYDTTSLALDNTFTELSNEDLTPAEEGILTSLQASIRSIQGTELLVLAKVSAGDVTGADQLFQNFYISRQGYIAQTIDTLVDQRTAEVSDLISQNNLVLTTLRTVVAVLFVLFILIFIAMWAGLSRGLVRPIEQLTEDVRKIGRGEREATITVEGSDEVGQLAQAFRDMNVKVKEAYEVLSKEQSQLLASVNSLPLGFIMIDIYGRAIVSNQAAKKIFHGESIPLDTITRQLGAPANIADHVRHVIATKTDVEIPEITFEEKSYRMLITPIILVNSKNEVIGAVILLEDISEEKRLERSKGTFVAIASHEMRTPLTIIRGNAELMLEGNTVNTNTELKSQVESILKGAVRLLAIVNDFLDVQNLEEGRIALKIEPVNLVTALQETIADFSKLAEKKGLSVTFDAHAVPSFPILQMDKYRLQQIYMNLISNAIHYTERGGVTLTMRKEGDIAKIFVSDTGIGMEAEAQDHLFQRFETGRAFLRSREYGSGMGLYISRILARMVGGDLKLEKSVLGVGSVFCLTIPLVQKTGTPGADGKQKAVLQVGNV